MEEQRFRELCETLDGFVNLNWMQRGGNVIGKLYAAARGHYREPLLFLAAQGVLDRVPREGLIVLTGGNIVLPTYLGIGETDGPAGVAILARAFLLGLNAGPVVLTEAKLVPGMIEVMKAAGFAVVDYESFRRYRADRFAYQREEFITTVLSFPDEDGAAKHAAEKLLHELTPNAVLASEKIGMNRSGVYHSSMGTDMSEGMARIDHLIDQARASGVLTIGIGDGGNEIGYGVIEDAVREHKLYGDRCQCPCGAGIATRTTTDFLITCEVSNWGAYALAAALLAKLGKPDLVHGAVLEERILESTARAGFIHLAREVGPMVDSFSKEVNVCVVELIRDVARKSEFDWFTARMMNLPLSTKAVAETA